MTPRWWWTVWNSGEAITIGSLTRTSFDEYLTGAPYVIAGGTTAVYTCLALLIVALHVEAATLFKAIVCEAVLSYIFLM